MSETTSPMHPAIGDLLGSIDLGEPRIHNGIGLWPLMAEPRPDPAYITLVEALQIEGFQITEISEGGSVPNLRVINETPHHVMLFDGEELKGAKQNRILNTTIVVPQGASLDVPVSCTESGRWSYESPQFSSSGSMAYAQLRKAKAEETVHDSPGLGGDHRLQFRWGHGSALRVEETIVHLALFGGPTLGGGHHPTEPPLRRRRSWA